MLCCLVVAARPHCDPQRQMPLWTPGGARALVTVERSGPLEGRATLRGGGL